jgi:regulator of sigma E protease
MNIQHILLLSAGWTKFFQFFIALSVLILIHEWGHYYAARRTGTRVEKFYLFFDFLFPFSELLPFSLWKKKVGDTLYGIGWFPMGGYVKIAGMVDESMDKEAMALPPKPDEFRSKSTWARLLIMLGGIIMNVLLAWVLYIISFAVWGEEKLPTKNMTYGIATDSLGRAAGLQDGDIINKVNNKEIVYYEDFKPAFLFGKEKKQLTVLRNGTELKIDVPSGIVAGMIEKKGIICDIAQPFVIDSFAANSTVKDSLKIGDRIIGLNTEKTPYFFNFRLAMDKLTDFEFTKEEKKLKDSTRYKKIMSQAAVLTVLRNNKDTLTYAVKMNGDGAFGVVANSKLDGINTTEIKEYTVLSAIPRALKKVWSTVVMYKNNLATLFTNKEVKVSKSLGGFYSFASIFPDTFTWLGFLNLTAFISILLAFMNLLPIPGLDGGYVMFLLYEIITGRKPNEKFMEYATTVGLVLLLGLMLYANGLDIWRAVTGK